MINRPKWISAKTTSKFVGVCFDKLSGRWASYIYTEKKRIWLGRFDNEIDAAKAYDKAAIELHGIFAKQNFPESADSKERSVKNT